MQGEGLAVPLRLPQKGTPPPKFPENVETEPSSVITKLPEVPVVDSHVPETLLLSWLIVPLKSRL